MVMHCERGCMSSGVVVGQYIFGNKTSGVGRWNDRLVGLIDFL